MGAIVKFFEGFATAISAIINFVVDMVADLLYIIKLTGQFLVNIPSYFSWLPAPVLAVIVSIFGIVVIYKIMGREG